MGDPKSTESSTNDPAGYAAKVEREAEHWAEHGKVLSEGEQHAWLDHPRVAEHYRRRGLIDGVPWERWVVARLGRPARRSLELGCGVGSRSMALFDQGCSQSIDGVDIIGPSIDAAEQSRGQRDAPGRFRRVDVNAVTLPRETYDLIFASHSFHHFAALEHIMDEVHGALTAEGLFVLEEFVGPTQFQWTDVQIELVRGLTMCLPERLRRLRWGATKTHEGRPTPEEVVAVSPFESIRSGEIARLFEERFQTVAVRLLGGTLQQLLYNGIVHNFAADDAEAQRHLDAVFQIEDVIIDAGLLPSDFRLLVGRRRARKRGYLDPRAWFVPIELLLNAKKALMGFVELIDGPASASGSAAWSSPRGAVRLLASAEVGSTPRSSARPSIIPRRSLLTIR